MSFAPVTRRVMTAIFRRFAETGERPSFAELAAEAGGDDAARVALRALADEHIIVLDDGGAIEMALPFSGVARPHRVQVDGVTYAANCAWDTFGILGALATARGHRARGRIDSRCPDCGDGLVVEVAGGRARGDALVHFVVPARKWWDDIRYT